ncbi:MAG: quinone-dependent dihydroorotate dehydrogenase [endosymbiont of Galathealinum brachiosum]|uniref:Dihydroorotate dehydrogenase (quinone) n=1 Tax=endosymbiont of Galathealinum brachiosum TaxID=2200906 RepID=A0A370D9W1_9GAMM|nr:MAG: quinone-dependent dihydroorotate dehydrogenase [endosymbiont of Galathealinum brachiosum]
MPYGLVKKILFMFNPETAHEISLRGLNLLHKFKLIKLFFGKNKIKPVNVMGINFPNKVGLAAGLDKDGEYFHALSSCGFGFVEIGTVTPLAQDGNDKPRLFRLESAEAIINRMGFNNKGVDNLLENVTRSGFKGVLGINIGKNKNTTEENAVVDYLICLEKVYNHADYITINISSPNTPGLRDLQFGETLQGLLRDLKFKQRELTQQFDRYVPLVVKVAPDMDDDAIESLANTFIEYSIDGVIVSNTTISREGVENLPDGSQQGGLSGRPLKEKADHSLQVMAAHLKQKIPVIAVGGISCADDAEKKIQLGASLVQIYTGFIYQGPGLVHECVERI